MIMFYNYVLYVYIIRRVMVEFIGCRCVKTIMNNLNLQISHASIEFPVANGPFKALDGVDLHIAEAEFVSLSGHSGSGKSTVLNIVADLYQATGG